MLLRSMVLKQLWLGDFCVHTFCQKLAIEGNFPSIVYDRHIRYHHALSGTDTARQAVLCSLHGQWPPLGGMLSLLAQGLFAKTPSMDV